MKTVLIVSQTASLYGASQSMLDIINGLKNKIKFVVLLPEKGPIENELDNLNIDYYVISYYFDTYDLSSIREIIYLIPKYIRNNIYFIKSLLYIKELNLKYNFDFIHSNSGVIRLGYYAAKIMKIHHIWHIREFQKEDYNLNILYGKKYFEKLLNKTDTVITISESITNHFNLFDKANLIYNGINERSLEFIPQYKKSNYLLYASCLRIEKGILDVIEALNVVKTTFPGFKLLI